MNLNQRIQAFCKLGMRIQEKIAQNDDKLQAVIRQAKSKNPWFIEKYVLSALHGIVIMLKKEELEKWLEKYPIIKKEIEPKTIGMVLAGNIPAVGFHDILCCLITGHNVCIKPSTKDEVLITFLLKELTDIEPQFSESIAIVDRLKDFDAVIATGSDNSARYFDYYFSKYPHIIRKNRASVAVLTGEETEAEIQELGKDLFLYFGLGCRNIGKIFLPKGYDLKYLYEPLEKYRYVIDHNKYANNYSYNRSIYLLNMVKHFDNGFLLLKEDTGIHSPLAVNYIEYYDSLDKVADKLKAQADSLQCIVSKHEEFHMPSIPLGKAQYPNVWDYADNVDTVEFLLGL